MQSVSPEERRKHLKRILLGSFFGLVAGVLCPHLPEPWQQPCRLTAALVHALVSP